ncbi:sphingomyelin synthase family protein [Anaeromyxobacter oryzisoli]|uniref:sphingomyelin synthase family protein n=1 Tax=Anaeromyxobacter oryzisoli TaxID=2925408 RepID=UPI001F563BA6|nr:sphingomyelin synthase family protein [Anaeromyxobacter sp. SG63]
MFGLDPGVALPVPAPTRAGALRAALPAVAAALAFRGACYVAMTAAAIFGELRPAPTLPDVVIAHVPYVEAVAQGNYLLWLVLYVPVAVLLLWEAPRRFARYAVTGGLVSLARGATIALTGLGPPDPVHAGPGLAGHAPLQALLALASPWQVFAHDAMAVYLTKDLFFSGHTATTFLLVLYVWPHRRLRAVALAGHVLVVASVFLAHLHYAIDVAGAYAVTFAIFALREGWPPRAPADDAAPDI